MIDLILWHSTIGCFYSKFKSYIAYSAFEKGMLHTALIKLLSVAVLHVKCTLCLALNDCFDLAVSQLSILMMLLHCSGYFNLKSLVITIPIMQKAYVRYCMIAFILLCSM